NRWQILNELFRIEPAATIPGLFEEMKYERRYVPTEPDSDYAPRGFADAALFHATLLDVWKKQPGFVPLSREDQLRSPQLWFIEIGPQHSSLVPVIIENLTYTLDGSVQNYAANLLAKIGPNAKAAVPFLLDIIKAKNLTALAEAARAIALIDGKERP